MNNSPLPIEEDDSYDPNVDIDAEIERRLFEGNYEEKMRDAWENVILFGSPHIYPDVE